MDREILKQELVRYAKWYQMEEMQRKEKKLFTSIVDDYLDTERKLPQENIVSSKPTEEQIFCWWIHFQWALASTDEYFEGLEDGFTGSIKWMLDNGYIQLTEKGKDYKPHYTKENT